MTVANYAENRVLNAIFNNTSLAITNTYIKLHIGDPGEDGIANAAVEATRKVASFTTATAGSVTNDADLLWSTVAATETLTHISIWDAVTAGNCLWVGPLTANKLVNAGDNATFVAGTLTVTLD